MVINRNAKMKKYNKLLIDKIPEYRIESVKKNGKNRPQDLYDAMHIVAISMTRSSKFGSLREGIISPASLIISWSPSLFTLLLSLLGRNVFYLCWGVPHYKTSILGYLKEYKLKLILRNAKDVFVNDLVTQQDVMNITGIKPTKIYYIVDNNYFYCAPYLNRGDYILVPGNNDRDEKLIVELSRRGYSIVRLTRDSRVKNLYDSKFKNDCVDMRFHVSVAQVRELYQNAKVVILPICSDNHAAGQTAVLEAISCGTPVVLSSGRTSTILDGIESVILCHTNTCEEWVAAIEQAASLEENRPGILKKSSDSISRHSPSSVSTSIIDIVGH